MTTKQIVCLANSRKDSGRCIAGLEQTANGFGGWIRPVSDRESEELAIEERRFENGRDPQVLDILEIELTTPRPKGCQVENYVIDDEYYWVFKGKVAASSLLPFVSNSPPLWVDGYSSYSGLNDRIPVTTADKLTSSLRLISVDSPIVVVGKGLKKRQVRLEFRLESTDYRLSITDPRVETDYLSRVNGEYPITGTVLVCVSIGTPWDGYRYKLAASVIPV